MTELEKLFGMDLINQDVTPQRIRIASALRAAVATGVPTISMTIIPEIALQMAADLEFAATEHPFGVPDDLLPPPLETSFDFYEVGKNQGGIPKPD